MLLFGVTMLRRFVVVSLLFCSILVPTTVVAQTSGLGRLVQTMLAVRQLDLQQSALGMEAERQRVLQFQQEAMAQDLARQQQARAALFVIRAQNAAVLILDTLQLAGETRQGFWNDVTPNLMALYNLNPLAEQTAIIEVMLPVARTYRDRRDGFTARLNAILISFGDSLKLDAQERTRLLVDAARAAQPLYARNLLATREEMIPCLEPVLAQYRIIHEAIEAIRATASIHSKLRPS